MAFLVVTLAVYGYWVMQPPSRYEAQFAEARQRARLPGLKELRAELQKRQRELQSIQWDRLSPGDCRTLRDQLAKDRLKPEVYVQALEGELARPLPLTAQPGWLSLPGLKQREQRLFRNDFMAMLERTRTGESFQLLGPDAVPDWDWFCGRHGVLRSPFIAPLDDCHEQFEKLHQTEAFSHLLAAIFEEHALSQQWPVSLKEIPGYQPLTPLTFKEASYDALGVNLQVSWQEYSLKRP